MPTLFVIVILNMLGALACSCAIFWPDSLVVGLLCASDTSEWLVTRRDNEKAVRFGSEGNSCIERINKGSIMVHAKCEDDAENFAVLVHADAIEIRNMKFNFQSISIHTLRFSSMQEILAKPKGIAL